MIKLFRDVYRGAGYLEGFGHHPGNEIFLFMIFACGIAGLRGGIWGFIGGAAFGAVGMGIPWVIGCRDRARNYDRDIERTFGLLKKEFN
jgi:hypothetical protein